MKCVDATLAKGGEPTAKDTPFLKVAISSTRCAQHVGGVHHTVFQIPQILLVGSIQQQPYMLGHRSIVCAIYSQLGNH